MPEARVVIVGAGPVGLVAALRLARSGVPVTVLEEQTGPIAAPRDMIYRWSTLPILDRMGVLNDLRAAGVTASRWCWRVLASGEQLVFDLDLVADEVAHPYNLHLSQEQFSAVMLAHLARYPHATVEWGTHVSSVTQDDHSVSVLANTPDGPGIFRADWAMGADGAHSTVRRSLGLGFAGMTWPERLVSLDLAFDFSQLGYLTSTYQLDPDRPALVAQLDQRGVWRYVYAENRFLLTDETVAERIPLTLAAVLPDGAELEPLAWSAHRVHERAADRLRVERVLLAGDAAHLTNPTASFGMAGGLYDAVVFADGIAAVIDGADPAVLDRGAENRERFFRTVASPLSSDTMQLVFHADSAVRLGQEVEHYRQIVTDRARHRAFLLLSRDLESLPAI